jgi:GT2 family glycosyltransferase
MGVAVVELDLSTPFTAARARNAGFHRLIELVPWIDHVQFLDGDCELNSAWVRIAADFLRKNPDVSVVCGRRRERFPEKTIYNLLCDFEWATAAGETLSCGGDALMRVKAFTSVNGFRNDLIAGEEPELCARLRRAGWKIWRLEDEMTLHDANMTSFWQWWKRAVRSGFVYAQGVHALERECRRERNRILLWAGVIPLTTLLLFWIWGASGLYLLLAYPLQVARLAFSDFRISRNRISHAFFLTLGKFPELVGVVKYYFNHLFGITNRLIEYK